jgi:membrane protein
MNIRQIFLESVRSSLQHEITRFSAAVAYYAVFSLAPLLFIGIGVLGVLLDNVTLQKMIFHTMADFSNPAIALYIEENVRPYQNLSLTLLGGLFTLIGASGVLHELKSAFHAIFEASVPREDLTTTIRINVRDFVMVLVLGLVLLVSLLMTLTLSLASTFFLDIAPPNLPLWEILNFFLSFTLLTGIFLFFYSFVPDVEVPFLSALWGSLFTALLFTLGKTAFGFYLSHTALSSAYGAAGSLVILLLWVFYSTQIFLFGAEITATLRRHRHLA